MIPDQPQVVEGFGLRLDHTATPEQVAWALFQAVRQDLRAAPGSAEHDQALALQCQLFNAELLDDPRFRKLQPDLNGKEFYFNTFILNWAPALGRYIGHLPDDLETLQSGFSKSPGLASNGREQTTLRYPLHDSEHGGPAGVDPGVTIRVRLTRTLPGYWRVDAVGFDRSPDLLARSAQP